MKPCRLLAVLLLLLAGALPAIAADLGGQASVVDGDTIQIHGQRIRLWAIDAPESRQLCRAAGRPYRCGQQAALALADKIGQGTVTCRHKYFDRYGRSVAACQVAGDDLGRWMVRAGWALAARPYSRIYVPDEDAARRAGRGLWRGTFEAPWEWRRDKRRPDEKTGRRCPVRVPLVPPSFSCFHAIA